MAKSLASPDAPGVPNGAPEVSPFDAAGAVDAPAIVLLHGSIVTRVMWQPQLERLAATHRVIAPDLPGHGVLAAVPFSMPLAARHVADLIGSTAQGRALVAGVSLGGYVAIEVARRWPERVAGLVLSGASVNFVGVTGLYLKLVGGLMQRGWLTPGTAQAERRVRAMFPPELRSVAEAQLRAGIFPAALGPSLAALAGRDFSAALAEYSGPTLILNGERDRAARRGESSFRSAARRARLVTLTGAGHACNLDQPAAYSEAVLGFAAEIGWTPAAET